jgi:hypothetical protein
MQSPVFWRETLGDSLFPRCVQLNGLLSTYILIMSGSQVATRRLLVFVGRSRVRFESDRIKDRGGMTGRAATHVVTKIVATYNYSLSHSPTRTCPPSHLDSMNSSASRQAAKGRSARPSQPAGESSLLPSFMENSVRICSRGIRQCKVLSSKRRNDPSADE